VNFVPIDQALNLKISDRQHISSMAITADGSTIYLCIGGGRYESKKGQGGYDIWYTTKMAGGWSELTNMGTVINTAGNEVSVSVLPDGKTLFFASDGLKGVGGYDIYQATYADSLKAWSKPVHLGYPINTPNNDVYYNPVPGNPRHAYYSVGRPDVADAYDTYFVNCYGEVLSDEKRESRRLEFLSALTKVREKPVNSKTAKLLAKKRYSKLSEKTPTVGRVKMILQGVKFSTNQSELSPNSFKSLNALYCWMRWHPGVRVQISGYTDNKGKESVNLKISRARAQSVANYLIKEGVYPEQIVVKGYGRKQPIASNKTAAGRALNRRVEVSVIAK
jgi:outer membrane protein OmpA-like peptidoglycan-associated protein